MKAIAEATAGRRLVEPRLSEDAGAAPCKIVADASGRGPRCSELAQLGREEHRRLERIGDRIDKEIDALQAKGLLYLLLKRMAGPAGGGAQRGQADPIDRSVELLEEAVARDPERAQPLSDLAGAYFIRAREQEEPFDFLRALDAADRAVAADPSLPQARFNRALVLQQLQLLRDAVHAWDEYLRVEPDPLWREEADARREALRAELRSSSWDAELLERTAGDGDGEAVRALVDRFRQDTRQHIERTLLARWAQAWLDGKTAEADRALRLSRDLASALVKAGGDRLPLDAVAAVEAADAGRRRALARGHLDFAEGYALYRSGRLEPAVDRLSASRQALRSAGSPFSEMPEFFLACVDFRVWRLREALARIERLRRWGAERPYGSFLGHVLWMRALIQGTLGFIPEALPDYVAAAETFRRIGEADNAATMGTLSGEVLDQIGLFRDAWKERFNALMVVARIRDPSQRFAVHVGMADAAFQQGRPQVALYFQNEVVRDARAVGKPALEADSLFWRALFQDSLGRSGQALSDLSRAKQLLDLADGADLRRARADIAMVEGRLLSSRSPAEAAERLGNALRMYDESGSLPLALLARRARAHALRLSGDYPGAGADLRAGIELSERLGRGLSSEEYRLAFLGVSEDLFKELISLQALDLGQAGAAFETADRARTRVLPARISRIEMKAEERARLLASEEQPLPLAGIQNGLPSGTTLVQYSVLEDRILGWLIERGEWKSFQVPLTRADLQGRVSRLRRFGDPDWARVSADLYDRLVRPWISGVAPGSLIVVVPDGALQAVPFSCLRDAHTGRFLVEDHRLAVAPSATLYVKALAEARPAGSRPRVLALGDPAFDRSLFQDLVALPAARAEARIVAGLFPGSSDLLIGEAATRREFLSRVRQYDWVHIAGHAMVNEKNPLLSMLVLAPAAGETGVLSAREIYPMNLHGLRMIVLSACETGGYSAESEGAPALARAFLAAGVPTVVASLWKVDDEPTAALFQAFYEELSERESTDPAAALRRAQLRLMKSLNESERSPAAWAAFEVIGAATR